MDKKIQLIWDFYGADAEKTATHHVVHLKEFMIREDIPYTETGIKSNGDQHGLAFLNVDEVNVIKLRDALRPNRAFILKD